jgi:hypothetical protein
MKKILFFGIGTAISIDAAFAQCDEPFFSKYMESIGSNKALEIYNPRPTPLNLSGYVIKRYRNGETGSPANQQLALEGIVPPFGVWVVVNGQTTEENLPDGGISPPSDPRLRAIANQLGNAYPGPMYFNGDDAVELVKVDGASETMIDLIGKIGEDPGTAWTSQPPYVGSAGRWLTANNTLIRRREVKSGVRSNPAQFNGLAEWDTLAPRPANNDTAAWWQPFGSHTCDCQTTAREFGASSFPGLQLFPNPASDRINLVLSQPARQVVVYSLSGKTINAFVPDLHNEISLSDYIPGVYIIEVRYRNGLVSRQKFSVNP